MLIVNRRINIPKEEFDLSFSRSSGPGGQNVNKVNTKVTLHWNVVESPSIDEALKERLISRFSRRVNKNGCLVITSTRYRDQARNIEDCFAKVREIVLESDHVPKKRKATRPTKASKRRRLEEKRRVSQRKEMRRDVGGE